jgi:hypothetical protein
MSEFAGPNGDELQDAVDEVDEAESTDEAGTDELADLTPEEPDK